MKLEIENDMEAQNRFSLNSLDTRWKRFHLELKRLPQELSEEAVHDLRVATRRLLALFDLLRSIIPHKRIQKFAANSKTISTIWMNCAIFRFYWQMYLNSLMMLLSWQQLQRWLHEEKRLMRSTRKHVQAHDIKNLSKRIEKTREMIQNLPEENLVEQSLAAVDDAYARVLQALQLFQFRRRYPWHS